MNRKLLICSLLGILITILYFLNPGAAYGSTIIFKEDFESGNINQWTSVRGPTDLWQIKQINGTNMFGARIENGSTIIDSIAKSTQIATSSYTLEFDYITVTGIDNSLDSRWTYNSTGDYYDVKEVHYLGENNVWTNFGCVNFINSSPLKYNFLNHIKIIYENQHMEFYLNDIKIIDYNDAHYSFPGNEYIGVRISTGASYPKEAWFDNIVVTSLDEEANLDVPVLKQTDPLWKNEVYDTATNWSPSDPTINSWGCAMTSAAMILNYHKINKLPDGNNLDPKNLNEWLSNQPDGYIGDGLTNWLAISRLSKLAKESGNNSNFDYDSLEYIRNKGEDKQTLITDINNLQPDILEEQGHFIVAKGISEDTFLINDPYYERTKLNQGYNNTFLSLGRYIPSKSDLSYLMLVVKPNINVEIKDSSGSVTPTTYFEEQIVNDENSTVNGEKVKIIYFPKPETGEYNLLFSSNTNQLETFKLYAYDINGTVKILEPDKGLISLSPRIFRLNYNKNNLNDFKLERTASFETTIADIEYLIKTKAIKNKGLGNALIILVKNAKKNVDKNQIKIAKINLNQVKKLIFTTKEVLINKEAYSIIDYDLKYLLNHL